jgi:hypothetical protein
MKAPHIVNRPRTSCEAPMSAQPLFIRSPSLREAGKQTIPIGAQEWIGLKLRCVRH